MQGLLLRLHTWLNKSKQSISILPIKNCLHWHFLTSLPDVKIISEIRHLLWGLTKQCYYHPPPPKQHLQWRTTTYNHSLPLRNIVQQSITTNSTHYKPQAFHNDALSPSKILQRPTTTHYHYQTIHSDKLPIIKTSERLTTTNYQHQTIYNNPLPPTTTTKPSIMILNHLEKSHTDPQRLTATQKNAIMTDNDS